MLVPCKICCLSLSFLFKLKSAARSTAELAAHWKKPLMSWYAPSLDLMNKTVFNTLVRTFPPIHKVVFPMIKLLDLYDYKNIGKVVKF